MCERSRLISCKLRDTSLYLGARACCVRLCVSCACVCAVRFVDDTPYVCVCGRRSGCERVPVCVDVCVSVCDSDTRWPCDCEALRQRVRECAAVRLCPGAAQAPLPPTSKAAEPRGPWVVATAGDGTIVGPGTR